MPSRRDQSDRLRAGHRPPGRAGAGAGRRRAPDRQGARSLGRRRRAVCVGSARVHGRVTAPLGCRRVRACERGVASRLGARRVHGHRAVHRVAALVRIPAAGEAQQRQREYAASAHHRAQRRPRTRTSRRGPRSDRVRGCGRLRQDPPLLLPSARPGDGAQVAPSDHGWHAPWAEQARRIEGGDGSGLGGVNRGNLAAAKVPGSALRHAPDGQ